MMTIPQSWKDFVSFVETGANVQQRPDGREVGDVLGLGSVAGVFDALRHRFTAGDRAALWDGIRAGCTFNVPLPYWLADGLLDADGDAHASVRSLHELLGAATILPLSRSRGPLARRNLALSIRLWREVQRQRARAPALSLDRAIKAARTALRFPYQQRQSVEMFLKQDARQADYAAPYALSKRNRLQRSPPKHCKAVT